MTSGNEQTSRADTGITAEIIDFISIKKIDECTPYHNVF
jgi:hypothetical protein